MKIAVCMKQVPAYSEGSMNEKTGLIERSGLPAIINANDLIALETALQIKEKVEAEISVFTMGPPNASSVLKEAYAMGADKGFLITDKAFGGADVLATSYTLMEAIKSCGEYELILCGKQTTDGDTGQVGGALAKWMEIPHFTGINKLLEVDEKSMVVNQQQENRNITLELTYPCLLAVESGIFVPRMPSLKLKMASKQKSISMVTLEELENKQKECYGVLGSATKVKKISPPKRTKRRPVVELEGKAAADYIQNILQREGILKEARE